MNIQVPIEVVERAELNAHHRELLEQVQKGCATLIAEFENLNFSAGLEAWMSAVFACNAYVDAQAPWALRKTDPERMGAVLGTLAAAVGQLTTAVAPVVPASAARLLAYIEEGRAAGRVGQPQPIFPRLELDASEQC